MNFPRKLDLHIKSVAPALALVFLAHVLLLAPAEASPALEETGEGEAKIVLAVTFDRSGKVKECELVRSNVPIELETSTVGYIRSHWNLPFFAGTTVTLPIVFAGKAGTTHSNGDFPLPPNPFPYDNQKYARKLSLTFDQDGWVTHVQLIQSSGIQLADDRTRAWIRAHWHHTAYANQVVEVPLEFLRPPPAPAVVAKPKPPAEPVAIPAIRVQ